MKKVVNCICLIVLIIISLIAMWVSVLPHITRSLSPLGKPEAKIRETILEFTPLGMSMDEVINMIESNKKWKIDFINYDFGYVSHDSGLNPTVIGKKTINAYIGSYVDFWKVYVNATWAFDENSKLIDVFVEKSKAAL